MQTFLFFSSVALEGAGLHRQTGVSLAKENEFPLKTGDKTVGLGMMGKRKTGTSARTSINKYFSTSKLSSLSSQNTSFIFAATESRTAVDGSKSVRIPKNDLVVTSVVNVTLIKTFIIVTKYLLQDCNWLNN